MKASSSIFDLNSTRLGHKAAPSVAPRFQRRDTGPRNLRFPATLLIVWAIALLLAAAAGTHSAGPPVADAAQTFPAF